MVAFVGMSVIAIFAFAFSLMRISTSVKTSIILVREAYKVFSDDAMDDSQKEKAVQSHAVKLLLAFVSIMLRTLTVFLVTLIPIIVADYFELVPYDSLLVFLLRWDVMLVTVVVMVFVWIWKLRPSS